MAAILYLVRHGETEWNRERRIQGHSDVKLTPEGLRQAELLASRLAQRPLAAVYASDLSRARETARKVANAAGVPLTTTAELRERCYGDWEGLTYEQIQERFQSVESGDFGIESLEAMQQRGARCLTQIARTHPDAEVAVVSHGGFINAFLFWASGGTVGTGITRIDNTGITVVTFDRDNWNIIRINDTEHLQKFPAAGVAGGDD